MSTPTPPGRHPVPGTGPERWWNGAAWTDPYRPAGLLNDAVTRSWEITPAHRPQPPHRPRRAGPPAGGAVAAVLLAGVVAAGLWALRPGDPVRPALATTLTVAVSEPPAPAPDPDSDDGTAGPGPAPGIADRAHGWRVPRPDGWTAEPATADATVLEVSGRYACDRSDGSPCLRGQFGIAVDSATAADARSAAEQEMAAFAPAAFGDLRSHREEPAGTLEIAGSPAWAIRWYVEPERGAAGYAVVAAVPDRDGPGYVILHGGVDDDPEAPDPSALDGILQGITPA
ncbi:hypothetical protein [Kitasatospora sp. NPDC088783]|uniref:hypothetical protein n=1 Tax=Kitasatospora sp. NPDC088783 TaxID=3364077 RepID=UPI00382890E0